MLANIAAQLLTLLRREPARATLLLLALLLAALQFFAPQLALLLEVALLRPLEALRLIASRRLCISRQARCHPQENARD